MIQVIRLPTLLDRALTACVGIALLLAGCDRPQANMQGQGNLKMTFYGLAVDESGQPVAGARFLYRVESYPADWTFDTRDRDNDVTHVEAISGVDGRFEFTVTACRLVRRSAELAEYRHLYEMSSSGGTARTSFYGLVAWGVQYYESDPDRPAVFVFVRDGVRTVSALPSRGGVDMAGPNLRTPNLPAWPREPSLKDVVYVPPATQPSTQPVTQPSMTSPAGE